MIRRTAALGAVLAALAAPAAGWAQAAPDAAASDATAPQASAMDAKAARRAAALKADKEDGKGGCFYITQLQGNHALNDRAVIFRVNVSDFYQLDFAQRCYALTYPEPKLILTPFGGVGLICRAIDLDVRVGEQSPGSFSEPCIPSALHRLSPAEVAAVPKKDLP